MHSINTRNNFSHSSKQTRRKVFADYAFCAIMNKSSTVIYLSENSSASSPTLLLSLPEHERNKQNKLVTVYKYIQIFNLSWLFFLALAASSTKNELEWDENLTQSNEKFFSELGHG
jgi:hypothetical protein